MQRSKSPQPARKKSFSVPTSPLFDPRGEHSLSRRASRMHSSIYSGSTGTSQSTSTLLDAQTRKPSPLVLTLTLVASISGFMFGYDTGYISSVLVTIGTDLDGRLLTTLEKEYISSSTSLGALLASLVAGPAADIFGRRASVLACDLLFIAGALCQYLTDHLSWMIAGRFVMGCGVGVGSLIAPLYISELAPGKFRGRLVIANCLAITGGQLVAYGIGAIMVKLPSGWRYVVLLSLVPCLLQFAFMLTLPDTPRFLIMKGRFDEATAVLRKVHPEGSQELIDANVEELASLNSLVPGKTLGERINNSFKELLSTGSNRRALFIGCGLQAAQQFVGFNAIMYFAGIIFQAAGYDNSTDVSCVTAGTNFIFTVVALFIIDRVGRRNILLWSMPFLCLSQIICAISFRHVDIPDDGLTITSAPGLWSIMIMMSLIGFVASYAIGLGNVPWQQSELFPQSIRGLGSSLTTATNWFGSMVISASFLSLMDDLTPCGTFLLFAAVTAFAYAVIYFTYPEMGGLQLEEIEQLLSNGFNVKKSVELHKERLQMNHYMEVPNAYDQI